MSGILGMGQVSHIMIHIEIVSRRDRIAANKPLVLTSALVIRCHHSPITGYRQGAKRGPCMMDEAYPINGTSMHLEVVENGRFKNLI
jgi:hypothetical protein